MTPLEAILARQAFAADLEARNYQRRAWNTLAHDGRLSRSHIEYHPRYDGDLEHGGAQVMVAGYNPTTNPAQLNYARNVVSSAMLPTLIANLHNTAPAVPAASSVLDALSGRPAATAATVAATSTSADPHAALAGRIMGVSKTWNAQTPIDPKTIAPGTAQPGQGQAGLADNSVDNAAKEAAAKAAAEKAAADARAATEAAQAEAARAAAAQAAAEAERLKKLANDERARAKTQADREKAEEDAKKAAVALLERVAAKKKADATAAAAAAAAEAAAETARRAAAETAKQASTTGSTDNKENPGNTDEGEPAAETAAPKTPAAKASDEVLRSALANSASAAARDKAKTVVNNLQEVTSASKETVAAAEQNFATSLYNWLVYGDTPEDQDFVKAAVPALSGVSTRVKEIVDNELAKPEVQQKLQATSSSRSSLFTPKKDAENTTERSASPSITTEHERLIDALSKVVIDGLAAMNAHLKELRDSNPGKTVNLTKFVGDAFHTMFRDPVLKAATELQAFETQHNISQEPLKVKEHFDPTRRGKLDTVINKYLFTTKGNTYNPGATSDSITYRYLGFGIPDTSNKNNTKRPNGDSDDDNTGHLKKRSRIESALLS